MTLEIRAHRWLLLLLVITLLLSFTACDYGTVGRDLPSKISFTRDDEIYVMDADGANQVNLTQEPESDEWPRWSPDGERIAFVSRRGGDCDIYVMDADGANVVRLTSNPARDDHPAWLPDGERIIFESGREGPPTLYIVDADGAKEAKLPHQPDGMGDNWALSPDGRRIAFECGFDIWVMDIESGEKTNLSRHPARDRWPFWSPDGKEIAFTSERDDHYEVYLAERDGNGLRKLTSYAGPSPRVEEGGLLGGYRMIGWFSNGERLLVWLIDFSDAVRWDLCSIGREDKDEVNLTTALPDGGMWPIGSCSPDGRRVVLSVYIPHLPESNGNSEIWLVGSDGGNLTRLTYNHVWDESPSWQPR